MSLHKDDYSAIGSSIVDTIRAYPIASTIVGTIALILATVIFFGVIK